MQSNNLWLHALHSLQIVVEVSFHIEQSTHLESHPFKLL